MAKKTYIFKIFAHQLGHNFGMRHDFDKSHDGNGGIRSRNTCNHEGIMSYNPWEKIVAKGWSECSVSDFKQHYEKENWGNGCLEAISDELRDGDDEEAASRGCTEEMKVEIGMLNMSN